MLSLERKFRLRLSQIKGELAKPTSVVPAGMRLKLNAEKDKLTAEMNLALNRLKSIQLELRSTNTELVNAQAALKSQGSFAPKSASRNFALPAAAPGVIRATRVVPTVAPAPLTMPFAPRGFAPPAAAQGVIRATRVVPAAASVTMPKFAPKFQSVPSFPLKMPAASAPKSNAVAKVKLDNISRQIAERADKMNTSGNLIQNALRSGTNPSSLEMLINTAQIASGDHRRLVFERDVLTLGLPKAKANRLVSDRVRLLAAKNDAKSAPFSSLPSASKPALTKKLNEYLQLVEVQVAQSERALTAPAGKRTLTLPSPRVVSANQLKSPKRQLSLAPSAAQPSPAMIQALSALFARALPPRKSEAPEKYVLRLKSYVLRGSLVAANKSTTQSPADAVMEAVKEVITVDGPALEEEAAKGIVAPAGEEAVVSVIDASEDVIADAAAAAAPEKMAEPSEADLSPEDEDEDDDKDEASPEDEEDGEERPEKARKPHRSQSLWSRISKILSGKRSRS